MIGAGQPDLISGVDEGRRPARSQRILNGDFHEPLHALDDYNRELSYSIDEGPYPVSPDEISSYEGHVWVRSVTESDGGTFVECSS